MLRVGLVAVVVEREVLGEREVEDEPASLPVLGDVPDARPRRSSPSGSAWLNSRPPTTIRPGLGVPEAREGVDQLGLPVVVDARDPDDLAGANLEREPADLLDAAVVDRRAGRRPGAASRPVVGGGFSTRNTTSRPTISWASAGLGRALARHGVDLLAAAQDADPVGDLEHLVQLVRDEDDRHPLGLQVAEDLEQLERLLRRQDGRRLVEDEDVGLAVERLQDLDPLLLADGEVGDQRVRVDLELELRGELADAGARRPSSRA